MEREELLTKLTHDILEATWHALQPHARRDVLVLVSRALALPQVGIALALDDAATISDWMAQHLLRKPSQGQQEEWDLTPRKLFRMLIVQPFVLVHELTPEEEALHFATTHPN